jgi:hypothetical protein
MLEYDPLKRIRPIEALKHPFFQERKVNISKIDDYFNKFPSPILILNSEEEQVSNDSSSLID